jgi:hypothetical protein
MLARNYVPADEAVEQPLARGTELMAADRPPEYSLLVDERVGGRIDYLVSIGVGADQVRLRRPLKVEIGAGDDMPVVVFAPDLEVGGAGFSIEHAFNDLSVTAWLLWKGLTNGDARLDESAHESLARFHAYLPNVE